MISHGLPGDRARAGADGGTRREGAPGRAATRGGRETDRREDRGGQSQDESQAPRALVDPHVRGEEAARRARTGAGEARKARSAPEGRRDGKRANLALRAVRCFARASKPMFSHRPSRASGDAKGPTGVHCLLFLPTSLQSCCSIKKGKSRETQGGGKRNLHSRDSASKHCQRQVTRPSS